MLTTVAVASRLGVTQSAIYRHVHNVDELATVASRQVVAAMQERLRTAILGADMTWGRAGMVRKFADLIVDMVKSDSTSFEIVDRGGTPTARSAQGSARCSTWAASSAPPSSNPNGASGTATPSGSRRRCGGPADPLSLIQDDVFRLARLVSDGGYPGGNEAIARMLELRMLAGYMAYSSDLNRRLGLPAVIN